MDATLRCAARVKGQAHYRACAAVRDSAPIADNDAMRRVLTVRGRTSAVLGMWPIRSEAARDIAKCFSENVDESVLTQVCTSYTFIVFHDMEANAM